MDAPAGSLRPSSRRRLLRAAALLAWPLAGCDAARRETLRWAGMQVREERETPFGTLSVVELGRMRYLAYGPGARFVYQSALDLDHPQQLAAPYTRLMMLGVLYPASHARMVHVGVGAGNMTGYAVRTFPQASVDAVDIDRHAVELGARWFGLAPHPRLRVHIEDGRRWLEAAPGPFDVVMLDAYDDVTIPAPLREAAFFALVASRLAPDGVLVQNVYTPIVDTPALLAAIRTALPQVDFYRVGDSAVVVAYRGPRRGREALAARARALDAELAPAHPLAALLDHRVAAL